MEFLDSAPVVPTVAPTTTHARHPNAARNANKTQSILLVLLSIAVVILAGVFFWVVLR
jgi:hypothetical protein